MKTIIMVLSLLVGCPSALADNAWSKAKTPLLGPPQVMGFYTGGCLAGAATLPLEGEGYRVMRPSRNRYYGHPDLVELVQGLGKQANALGGRLLIGDLSQPRGGPMPYGHRSHQIGLDADIWFYQGPEGRDLSHKEIEKLPMLSMIRAAQASMDTSRWSPLHRDLLKLTAQNSRVERIFVNPIIKQELCRTESDRAWLRKIRAWWGHDAHFHVRLSCPAGNPQCRPQKPVPSGDGCGKDLDHWVWEIQEAALSPPTPKKKAAKKPASLPAACQALVM